MSSTTRSLDEAKDAADFYPTPQQLCDAAVAALVADKYIDLNFGPALEPSCGTGNWIRALRSAGYAEQILGVERHPENVPSQELLEQCSAKLELGDFMGFTKASLLGEEQDFEDGGFGLIIGNPPFSQASAFIRHALSLLKPDGVLALVLRVGWFTSEFERDKATPRRDWIWGRLLGVAEADPVASPRHFKLVMPRPQFGGKGTDSATYVIAVWTRPFDAQEAVMQKQELPTMAPLVWRERGVNAIERRRGRTKAAEVGGAKATATLTLGPEGMSVEFPAQPSVPEVPDTIRNIDPVVVSGEFSKETLRDSHAIDIDGDEPIDLLPVEQVNTLLDAEQQAQAEFERQQSGEEKADEEVS